MRSHVRRFACITVTIGLLGTSVRLQAGENTVSNINTKTDGGIESGWVVHAPAGASDFFNVNFELGPSLPSAIRNGTLKGVTFVHPQTPRPREDEVLAGGMARSHS